MKNTLFTVVCYLFSIAFVAAQREGAKDELLHNRNDLALAHHQTVGPNDIIQKIEIPAITDPNSVIYHTGYTLSYSEKHEQSRWVAYQLKKDETISAVTRINEFFIDPYVQTGSANDLDYEGYGYDRGHLAPAADMAWSASAMAESFYYSNVSPQVPAFNRGAWKRLEELVRFWATAYDSIYIVTGPVLTNGLSFIGPHHVSVPRYYYKAILRYGAHPAAIGFVLPNQASAATLKSFAVSIDSLEALTGIDFFPLLPDVVEKRAESVTNISYWKWNRNLSNVTQKAATYETFKSRVNNQSKNSVRVRNPTSTAVQCSGTTKAGRRCLRRTTNATGRCWQH